MSAAVDLRAVEAARAAIRDSVYLSPLGASETLSRMAGCRVLLKLENLQMTGSFKERGALWRILQMDASSRARGVITASAGNHGLAVAYHAAKLSIRCMVVMPEFTPLVKVSRVRARGAEVVFGGATFDEAARRSRELEGESGMVYIHPFDDPHVIAGQGTIGLELLEQEPDLDSVIVPVGGGGLIAGVATAIKGIRSGCRIWGVQVERYPGMMRSVEAGTVTAVGDADTLADGIAVKRPGELTLPLVRALVDGLVTVTEDEMAGAILLLAEEEKAIAEGAGAAALAALLAGRVPSPGKRTAVIVSGGNIDMNMIARIIERGLVRDGRRVRLTVEVRDRPGSLHRITGIAAGMGANILEIAHERAFSGGAMDTTEIAMTLETRGRSHVEEILGRFKEEGIKVREVGGA